MRIKYRKAILLCIMSTFGIGIFLLLLYPDLISKKKSESLETSIDKDIVVVDNNTTENTNAENQSTIMNTSEAGIAEPTVTPAITHPVYELEEGGYPEIEELIQKYYQAKVSCDKEKMKKILSNPDTAPTLEQMKADVHFVEEYQNIKCYTKKGYEENSYIVYAYHEIKYVNISTAAPATDNFYVITDSKGELKIYSDPYSEELEEYYFARRQDEDVQELIRLTNEKSKEAKKKDKLLDTFWTNLEKMASEEKASDTSD